MEYSFAIPTACLGHANHHVDASRGLNFAPSFAVFLVLLLMMRLSPLKLPDSSMPRFELLPPSFGPVSGSFPSAPASSANHSRGPQDLSSFFPFVSGTLPFGMPFAPLHLINGGSALRRSALCEESGAGEITGEGEIINPEQELMSSMAILMLMFMI